MYIKKLEHEALPLKQVIEFTLLLHYNSIGDES